MIWINNKSPKTITRIVKEHVHPEKSRVTDWHDLPSVHCHMLSLLRISTSLQPRSDWDTILCLLLQNKTISKLSDIRYPYNPYSTSSFFFSLIQEAVRTLCPNGELHMCHGVIVLCHYEPCTSQYEGLHWQDGLRMNGPCSVLYKFLPK